MAKNNSLTKSYDDIPWLLRVIIQIIGGAIVGGVSASGGYGTIYGTVLGAYVIIILKQGLPYIGFNANIMGTVNGLAVDTYGHDLDIGPAEQIQGGDGFHFLEAGS